VNQDSVTGIKQVGAGVSPGRWSEAPQAGGDASGSLRSPPGRGIWGYVVLA